MKRGKKRRRIRSSLHPKDGYISDREAESQFRMPRELLDALSGSEVRVPDASGDRQIRRRVVLGFWSECAHLPLWPCPRSPAGEPLYPEKLFRDFNWSVRGKKPANENERLRFISLWCWAQLLEESDLDEKRVFGALCRDIDAGLPAKSDVDREYSRFYGETELALRN